MMFINMGESDGIIALGPRTAESDNPWPKDAILAFVETNVKSILTKTRVFQALVVEEPVVVDLDEEQKDAREYELACSGEEQPPPKDLVDTSHIMDTEGTRTTREVNELLDSLTGPRTYTGNSHRDRQEREREE